MLSTHEEHALVLPKTVEPLHPLAPPPLLLLEHAITEIAAVTNAPTTNMDFIIARTSLD